MTEVSVRVSFNQVVVASLTQATDGEPDVLRDILLQYFIRMYDPFQSQ